MPMVLTITTSNEFSEESDLATFQTELEEEIWEAAYLENRDKFRAMAFDALVAFEMGETLDMVIQNGKIQPE